MELNQRKLLSLKSWKDLAAKGQAPEGAVVLVSCEIPEVKQLDDHGNVFRFIISSSNPDRDKDVIKVEGWDFKNYNKNPVVLFGHNYRSLPVATGSTPIVDGNKVLSDADFSATRSDGFAETVRPYVKARVLRASSVGFDPIKWVFDETRRGYDFVEQELDRQWYRPLDPVPLESLATVGEGTHRLGPYLCHARRADTRIYPISSLSMDGDLIQALDLQDRVLVFQRLGRLVRWTSPPFPTISGSL